MPYVPLFMRGCIAGRSSAQDVKTDYDRNANFGQYKSYSWERVQTADPLVVDRIKSAVNGALAAKGFTEVPSGGDFSVVAMGTTQNQQTLDTVFNNFGGGWRWGELETPPQPQRPTRSGPWSSTSLIQTQRN
jgi:hypothetical protein